MLVLAIVFSMMAGLIVVSNAYGGTSCIDFIYLRDAEHNTVGSINSGKRKLGDLTSSIRADNVQFIRIQGWHSEDIEIVDIGFSVDEGDIQWGYSYYDENLVKNKVATQHEYPLRFGAEIPVEEGEDMFIQLWYKLEDGEEDSFGVGYEFWYTYQPTSDSFISLDRSMVKYIDGEIAPANGVITVSDPTNEGKDWIGLFYLGDYDLEDFSPTEDEYLGWKCYANKGEKIEFNAENFKQEGAQDLEIGNYALALLENDTYTLLNAVSVVVAPEGGEIAHYDNVSIEGLEPYDDPDNTRDYGAISEEVKAGNNTLWMYGWYVSDVKVDAIGYRLQDGTEQFFAGKDRSDASNAMNTIYGIGIDLKIPVEIAGIDVPVEVLVKYASGEVEVCDTFYYTYDPTGEFTPKPTPEPTPTPTPTEVPTDTPAPTDAPETPTEAPVETEAPQNTEAPTEKAQTETKTEKKGCGGFAAGGLALIALAAAVVIRKKH